MVARGRKPTSGGEQLAREFRALGALALTAIAIHYGKLAPWFLLIGAMDYLLLFTDSWLKKKGKGASSGWASTSRRYFQYLYLGFLSIALFPTVKSSFSTLMGLLFGLPYFFIALRDWFILAGLLDPERNQYRQIAEAGAHALTGWLALSIRLLAAMAVATVAADMVFHFDMYANTFHNDLLAGGVALLLFVALPFLFLGVRTRIFALIGVTAFAIILLIMGPNTVIHIGLSLLGVTLVLGQGKIAVEKTD